MRPSTGCVRRAGVLQPLKDRRTRRLQTLFGTVEVGAPRFKVCRCRQPAPMAGVTVSPVGALLRARCTPELERVQAELGARTSFRDGVRTLDRLLPASPANHESLRTRSHAFPGFPSGHLARVVQHPPGGVADTARLPASRQPSCPRPYGSGSRR